MNVILVVVAVCMLLTATILAANVSMLHVAIPVSLIAGASILLGVAGIIADRWKKPERTVDEVTEALRFEVTCRPALLDRTDHFNLIGALAQEFDCQPNVIRQALLHLQQSGEIVFENGAIVCRPN